MTNPTNGGPQPQAAAPETGPQVNVLAQYIKDLSFENPNAPQSLQPSQQPSINLQINVGAQPMGETDIEVSLKVDGKAETAGGVMFAFELVYAGIFRIQNAPQDVMGALVMIECPRLLFPFVRELISSLTRNGGFPPLMIDPVDFVALYRQRMTQGEPGATAQV